MRDYQMEAIPKNENVSLVLARLLDAYESGERLTVNTRTDGTITFRVEPSPVGISFRNERVRK
jgi:hypothetical protein